MKESSICVLSPLSVLPLGRRSSDPFSTMFDASTVKLDAPRSNRLSQRKCRRPNIQRQAIDRHQCCPRQPHHHFRGQLALHCQRRRRPDPPGAAHQPPDVVPNHHRRDAPLARLSTGTAALCFPSVRGRLYRWDHRGRCVTSSSSASSLPAAASEVASSLQMPAATKPQTALR